MKDHLARLVSAAPASMRGLTAREYLQARILQSLQESGAFLSWAFVGGTALRFLFDAPRFSEDIDLSVIEDGVPASFRAIVSRLVPAFTREGYAIDLAVKDARAVASAFVRFPGLPQNLGLSPRRAEVLSIKMELDTRPPAGAGVQTTLVRRHVTLNLLHYDKASLLSGKIHALLTRPYTKGRDLFDLVWYLADRSWPPPNLGFLNAALRQTGWSERPLTGRSWRKVLASRLSAFDWRAALRDVEPFLERPEDAALVTLENARKLLDPAG